MVKDWVSCIALVVITFGALFCVGADLAHWMALPF